jgi:hypothetical protein
MYSFYDLGKDGRVTDIKLQGDWYLPGDTESRTRVDRVANDFIAEIDAEDDDFSLKDIRVHFFEHEGQMLFSAHRPREVDAQLLLGMYVIGRFEMVGDCVCFQVLAREAADKMVAAGLPVAVRRHGDAFTEEDERERQIPEGDVLKLFRELMSEEPVAVTIATPTELREFLVSTPNDPVTFRSLTFCPGDPPVARDGEFDHVRFARDNPEAAAYIEEFGP